MFLRTTPLFATTFLLVLAFFLNASAQDVSSIKPGVVRIQNNRTGEVGAGLIVKLDQREVYIVTTSHEVDGDQTPNVYLFNQQRDALQSELLDRQEDTTKGLALLRLKVSSRLASGISALTLGYTSQVEGGENIKFVGFPDSVAFWTVGGGIIGRLDGHNLVFSGPVRGGNSGGPVILGGVVLGMITDVSQASAYAARSEVIEIYVNGIVRDLISLSKPNHQTKESSAARTPSTSINNELSPKTQQSNKSEVVRLERFEDAKGKYGYRREDGTIIIAARYDRAFSFSGGLANVELNGKQGFINDRGEPVIPLIYEYLGFFHDGLAIAELDRKYGFIDLIGKVVIPIKYGYVGFFHDGLANAQLQGKYGFIDTKGRIVITFRYDHASWFSHGKAKVQAGGRAFYIDKNGNEVGPN